MFIIGLVPIGTANCQKALTSFVLPSQVPCVAFIDGNQHVGRFFFQDHKWNFDDITSAAHAPAALGGSALTSFVLHDGSPHIVYIDQQHHLEQLFYLDKWRVDDLTANSHSPAALPESGLSSFLLPDGSPHIVYIDVRRHVDQLFFQNSSWHFDDVAASVRIAGSALPGSGLSSFVLPDGLPQIAFIDRPHHLIQLFFQDHKWRAGTLSSPERKPISGGQ